MNLLTPFQSKKRRILMWQKRDILSKYPLLKPWGHKGKRAWAFF